jgi:poly(3-hydroxybutyrate) depolymerase
MHGPAEEEYRSQLEHFMEEHGAIINAYWCTSEASAVAITEKPGSRVLGFLWRRPPTIRFHSATDWATRDGCPGEPAVFLDTPQATGVRWSGCRDGSEVVHFRINGGDHQAPRTIAGRPFAQVAWDFFAAHPLPG